MKKIISVLLSVAMLAGTAVITANANTDTDVHKYTVLDSITLKDGQINFYTYNYSKDNPATGIQLDNKAQNSSSEVYFNDINGYKQVNVPTATDIEHWFIFNNGRSGIQSKRYNNTGGTYEKIRIKLSDYSDYFNSDGSHTFKDIDYNFSTQKEEVFTKQSALVFWSGGVFTAVTPSKDGYAELYVSKKIGENTKIYTEFSFKVLHTTYEYVGKNGDDFGCFAIGDADASGGVYVDDVTAIQSYVAGTEVFDNLQMRNADVNFDGTIDVSDATMVQKYLAGYDV